MGITCASQESIKGNLRVETSMVKELLLIQIAEFTKEDGLMVCSPVTEFLHGPMEINMKDSMWQE